MHAFILADGCCLELVTVCEAHRTKVEPLQWRFSSQVVYCFHLAVIAQSSTPHLHAACGQRQLGASGVFRRADYACVL